MGGVNSKPQNFVLRNARSLALTTITMAGAAYFLLNGAPGRPIQVWNDSNGVEVCRISSGGTLIGNCAAGSTGGSGGGGTNTGGVVQIGDGRWVKQSGDTMTGTLVIANGKSIQVAGTISGTTLKILGTMSGNVLHVEKNITASGSIITESLLSGATLQGFGLGSCSGASQKLLYNNTTKTFSCGADQSGGTGATAIWSQSSGTIYPTSSTGRVLIGNATDDGSTPLQVKDTLVIQEPGGYDSLKFISTNAGAQWAVQAVGNGSKANLQITSGTFGGGVFDLFQDNDGIRANLGNGLVDDPNTTLQVGGKGYFLDATNTELAELAGTFYSGHFSGPPSQELYLTDGNYAVSVIGGGIGMHYGQPITFIDAGDTNTVKVSAPATVNSSYQLYLPPELGGTGNTLITDGMGNLHWGSGSVNSGTGANYWTQSAGSLYPTTGTDRVRLGGALDDFSSPLQLSGSLRMSGLVGGIYGANFMFLDSISGGYELIDVLDSNSIPGLHVGVPAYNDNELYFSARSDGSSAQVGDVFTIDGSGRWYAAAPSGGSSGGSNGWVDDGTVVRLDTVTDRVGVGRAVPTTGVKLDVVGSISGSSVNVSDFLKGYQMNEHTVLVQSGTTLLVGSGAGALSRLEYGLWSGNTLIGMNAGYEVRASYNTLVGFEAGKHSFTTLGNTFIGARAGENAQSSGYTVGIGMEAGRESNGTENVFIGYLAGRAGGGSKNIMMGTQAGQLNSGGNYNFIAGYQAGYNSNGDDNIFMGRQAGYASTTGQHNIFMGPEAGYTNDSGDNNVFLGDRAGYTNSTGSQNVMIGFQPGRNNSDGSYNVFTGYYTGFSNISGDNNIFSGLAAGYNNTTGYNNIFMGHETAYGNISGYENIMLGTRAGSNNVSGSYNIFQGYKTGTANTFGGQNIMFGYKTGYTNSNGSYNILFGYQTGYTNNAGNNNVMFGYEAGYNNIADNNIFTGFQSGYNNTSGTENIFSGTEAGFSNTSGNDNIFSGNQAGYSNTIGYQNIFIGYQTGFSNTTGERNIFSGTVAGYSNTTGNLNIFTGQGAGYSNTEGNNNIFSGTQAGYLNTTGSNNIMFGYTAGYSNIDGFNNIFSGYLTGYANTSGSQNTFIGHQAGNSNTTGANNILLGAYAGATLGTGTGVMLLGYATDVYDVAGYNATAIGYQAIVSQDNSIVLGSGANVGIGTSSPATKLEVVGTMSGSNLTITELKDCGSLSTNIDGLVQCGGGSGGGISFADGDSRYVKKSGDTMTGTLTIDVLNGTVDTIGLNLINTLSGAQIHAENNLTTSGSLIWEGTASGNTLVVSKVASHLIPSADNTWSLGTNTLRWKDLYLSGASLHVGAAGNEGLLSYSTSQNFLKLGTTNQPTGLTMLNSNGNIGIGTIAPETKLEVIGTISGSALTVSGLKGCGALGTDINGSVSCGSSLSIVSGDARYVKKSGDTMTGALAINVTGGNQNTLGLRVLNTASGAHLHAEQRLTSSGTLVTESGAYIAGTTLVVQSQRGAVGIGTSTLSGRSALVVSKADTVNISGTTNGISATLIATPTAAATLTNFGVTAGSYYAGIINSPSASMIGVSGAAGNTSRSTLGVGYGVSGVTAKSGTGVITFGLGVVGQVQNNNAIGAITQGAGLYVLSPLTTGPITSQYGLQIDNQATSNVTNANGVYIRAQSGAVTTNNALLVDGGQVILNEDGSGKWNFRVESDTNANMLFVDGLDNRVGIGTGSPKAALSVAGTMSGTSLNVDGTSIESIVTGTATLDFGNLIAAGCSILTMTVGGATTTSTTVLGIPNASDVTNGTFTAWVSAANTVTVKFCTVVSGDPASGSFRATVINY